MRPKARTVERLLARIARQQHGNVTRAQLLAAGITPAEIRTRVRSGALLTEHRGVYRVGHRGPSVEARYVAAVLACGEGARLSGLAAAHVLGLIKGRPPSPEVTAPTERRVRGIRTRRSRDLNVEDGTTWRGIAVTTVARTLVDLAAVLPLDALARACHEAGVRHRTTPAQVEKVLRRRPNATGAAQLRIVLIGGAPVSLSRLESKFLDRLREANLPLPDETNRRTGGHRVDCRYRNPALTIELDSYRYHGSRHAWEEDRQREREAYARGDAFRRYTYGDVYEDPRLMLAELVALLPTLPHA